MRNAYSIKIFMVYKVALIMHFLIISGGVLFAVNGPDYSRMDVNVQGFTLDIDTGKLKAQWNIPKKVRT